MYFILTTFEYTKIVCIFYIMIIITSITYLIFFTYSFVHKYINNIR